MDGEQTSAVAANWKVSRAQMTAAACTKMLVTTFFFPLDTVKARIQFQSLSNHHNAYKNGLNAFTCIAREEGMLGFYRGLFIRLLSGVPKAGISFGFYEQFRRLFGNWMVTPHDPAHTHGTLTEVFLWITGACCLRLMGTAYRTPFDIIKQRMQIRGSLQRQGHEASYSTSQLIKSVIFKEGWGSLFQGYVTSIMRDVPFVGIYFASYELAKFGQKKVLEKPKLTTINYLFGGAFAGFVATAVTLPLDIVKLKIQTNNALPPDQQKFHSIPETYRLIYRQEGLHGFFRGWAPAILKNTPQASVSFACYEFLKRIFLKYSVDD